MEEERLALLVPAEPVLSLDFSLVLCRDVQTLDHVGHLLRELLAGNGWQDHVVPVPGEPSVHQLPVRVVLLTNTRRHTSVKEQGESRYLIRDYVTIVNYDPYS